MGDVTRSRLGSPVSDRWIWSNKCTFNQDCLSCFVCCPLLLKYSQFFRAMRNRAFDFDLARQNQDFSCPSRPAAAFISLGQSTRRGQSNTRTSEVLVMFHGKAERYRGHSRFLTRQLHIKWNYQKHRRTRFAF